MPDYVIRAGTLDDAARCEAIEIAAAERFRAVDMDDLVTITANDPYMRAHAGRHAGDGSLIVAVHRELIIGYAALADVDGLAHLCEIDVLPSHAGLGVGRSLIKASETWAIGQEHSAITLSTFIDVPWNGPWYARQGFEPYQQLEWGAGHLSLWQGQLESALDCTRRHMMIKRLG